MRNGQEVAAFIANTDFGWFSHFLHRAEPPDEVDFWQPSPHGFKAIPPGAPFFFRLGAPHKAIAGFGFFVRYERVPAWLAWESFGDKNGTDTFAEMAARIEAIRRRTLSAPTGITSYRFTSHNFTRSGLSDTLRRPCQSKSSTARERSASSRSSPRTRRPS